MDFQKNDGNRSEMVPGLQNIQKIEILRKMQLFRAKLRFFQITKTKENQGKTYFCRFWQNLGQNTVEWSQNPKVPKMIPVVYIYVWESLGAKKLVFGEIS